MFEALLEGGDEGHEDLSARLQEEHDGLAARVRGESSEFEKARSELSRLHAREASVAAQLGARAEGLTELEQRLAGTLNQVDVALAYKDKKIYGEEELRRRLSEIFEIELADDRQVWELDGDGIWHRVPTTAGVDAHRALMERAVARSHELRSDGRA